MKSHFPPKNILHAKTTYLFKKLDFNHKENLETLFYTPEIFM